MEKENQRGVKLNLSTPFWEFPFCMSQAFDGYASDVDLSTPFWEFRYSRVDFWIWV